MKIGVFETSLIKPCFEPIVNKYGDLSHFALPKPLPDCYIRAWTHSTYELEFDSKEEGWSLALEGATQRAGFENQLEDHQ